MTSIVDEKVKTRRLAIFEKVKVKLAASGHTVKNDAAFIGLVTQWSEDRISLEDVLEGYRRVSGRNSSQREGQDMIARAELTDRADTELISDLERVIGMVDLKSPSQS